MQDPLSTALVVTGVGMLALFVALALLYGLMYLMTTFIKDPPLATLALDEKEPPPAQETALRAALIAVALACAEQELQVASAPPAASALPGDETSSAWRALHHQRQLTLNPRTRKTL